MNILVVDDTRVILEAISDFLDLEGYKPILASSALEGLNMLNQVDAVIAVVSIEMLPLNGFDFAMTMRRRNYNIPIIFMSSEKYFEHLYKNELEELDNCGVIFKHQISAFIDLLDMIKHFSPKS